MKKIVIILLFSFFAAQPAIADLYTGIKVGGINYNYGERLKNGQLGYGLLYGNTVTQFFSVEGEFISLGGHANTTEKVTGSAYSMSAIGFHPIKPRYSLFGKLGLYHSTLVANPKSRSGISESRTISNTGLTVGAGVQHTVSQAVSIRAGADSYPDGGILDVPTVYIAYICTVLKF